MATLDSNDVLDAPVTAATIPTNAASPDAAPAAGEATEVATAAEPVELKSLDLPALTEWVLARGHKKYRAEQLFQWIHGKCARSFDEMTNVPSELRDPSVVRLGGLDLDSILESSDGTRKLLLRTSSGERLESVVIPMGKGRWTQCVSSQIGCKMGCDFCATAEMPRRKNLTSAEIVDQIYTAQRLLMGADVDVVNLVFMGMGEPLDNFDNVTNAIRILLNQKGQAFGSRRITVSTVGLVPKIHAFAAAVPVNLAVSLNATTDAQRDALMPINRKFPIGVLLETLKGFPMSPRRRIFVEYVMLGGVNDSNEDAQRLPKLLEGVRAKVNLIPFNPYPDSRYRSPGPDRVLHFVDVLMKAGIQTNVREPKGRDIQAACGMLDGARPI